MNLNWQGNIGPISATNGGTLQTSHGPALVAADTLLDMIYVGKSGANLWSASTLAVNFPQWETNARVDGSATLSGSALESSFRPALALFNGLIHMVYVGEHGQNLWWATAKPNGQWSNVQLPFSGAQDVQPALGVHSDGKLYLAWHEFIAAKPATYVNGRLTSPAQPEQNNIRYSSLDGREPFEVDSWAEPQLAGSGAVLPALCSHRGVLHLAATPESPRPRNEQILMSTLQRDGWSPFAPLAIVGREPLSAGGGAMTVLGDSLYIVYPGSGGHNIWYAWIDALGQSHGDVQVQIEGGGTPETSAPLGVTAFDGLVCVAYKGKSGNNVWMSYGKP